MNRAGGHPGKAAINCLQGALSSSTNKVWVAVFIHRGWLGGGGLQGCRLLGASRLAYTQLVHTSQQNTCCAKRSGPWHRLYRQSSSQETLRTAWWSWLDYVGSIFRFFAIISTASCSSAQRCTAVMGAGDGSLSPLICSTNSGSF